MLCTAHYTSNQDAVKEISKPCADEKCSDCCTRADNEEERRNEFIASKRDLNAQEGVWRASNLMAILTGFATIIGVAGIYLLKATLDATNSTLKVAQESNDEIMRSNVLQLKPYLTPIFSDVITIRDWDSEKLTQTFQLMIYIKNSGKTPASEVFVSIEKSSSLGWWRGTGNSADFQSISAMSAQEQYIGDSLSTLALIGVWRTNRASEWPADQERGVIRSENEWTRVRVTLRDLCIRYKDLECEGESWHKLIRGDIHLQDPKFGSDGRFRISLVDTEEDKDHDHYKSFEFS